MSRVSYIQEKLNRFAIDYGLEFRTWWDKNIQRYIFRFVNREFKLGYDFSLSYKEIYTTNPEYLVEFMTNKVKKSNINVF